MGLGREDFSRPSSFIKKGEVSVEFYDYPLVECNDCIHKRVCKYINQIEKVKEESLLPLDFDTTSCLEYIPETILDEPSSASASDITEPTPTEFATEEQVEEYIASKSVEEVRSELHEMVSNATRQLIEQGISPFCVEMSARTATLFHPQGKTNVEAIVTPYGNLEVELNEDIPYGQFEMLAAYGEDYED